MNIRSTIHSVLRSTGYELSKLNRAGFYDEDGLRSIHSHGFVTDPAFKAAYDHAFQATSKDPAHHGPWRVHIAMWAAKTALRRQGDFVECGTARAFVSTAVMTYTDWNKTAGDRNFYLVDTYEGSSEELLLDTERAQGAIERHGNRYLGNYPDAQRNVASFRNVTLIQGRVPEVLANVPVSQLAYLHLDMNSAVAETAALEYFWDKLVVGGVVLMDDYCYVGYEPQRLALDKVARAFGVEIASLPTGQGLLVK